MRRRAMTEATPAPATDEPSSVRRRWLAVAKTFAGEEVELTSTPLVGTSDVAERAAQALADDWERAHGGLIASIHLHSKGMVP